MNNNIVKYICEYEYEYGFIEHIYLLDYVFLI